MYKEHRVVVVVPAYDEEALIQSVIETMPAFVDRIIVVDDCSRDRTSDVVSNTQDERTTLLKTPSNQGVGGATVLGYREALAGGCDIVVKMDGDGQMAPEYLSRLLDTLIDDGFGYAKGNRFLSPEALPLMPKARLLGNIASTFLTKLASGYWQVFDPQNGYTAIKANLLEEMDLEALHRRFFFENDMLVQLSLLDARVRDVAIPARYGSEISSLSPLRALGTFPPLLLHRCFRRVWHNYVVRDFSPIALFLFAGLALGSWGVGFGLFTWIKGSMTGQYASTGTVMLSVLPFFMGFQLLLQAIVLDIQHSPK